MVTPSRAKPFVSKASRFSRSEHQLKSKIRMSSRNSIYIIPQSIPTLAHVVGYCHNVPLVAHQHIFIHEQCSDVQLCRLTRNVYDRPTTNDDHVDMLKGDYITVEMVSKRTLAVFARIILKPPLNQCGSILIVRVLRILIYLFLERSINKIYQIIILSLT